MEWILPLGLVICGALGIAMEHVLRRYVATHWEAKNFQKNSYYSMRELGDRFAKRVPLSWAMIIFGLFWSFTNII